jgi:hypothetical protein
MELCRIFVDGVRIFVDGGSPSFYCPHRKYVGLTPLEIFSNRKNEGLTPLEIALVPRLRFRERKKPDSLTVTDIHAW